ncbi:hypothetical protein ACLOJK_032233 [Asimina triloba]
MGAKEVVPIKDRPSASSGSQNINQGSTVMVSESNQKPKKKICCACPETKRLRDECIVEHGEDACTKWIEAHLICLRAEGFKLSNLHSVSISTSGRCGDTPIQGVDIIDLTSE